MKKRTLTALCALMSCLTLMCASAAGLQEEQPLTGMIALNGDLNAGQALTYALPQFVSASESDAGIILYYAEAASRLPERFAALEAPTELTYQITRNDSYYLSVLFSVRQLSGSADSETLYADVFARDGLYAGQKITLTEALGLEPALGEAREAEGLTYRLIWDIISADMARAETDYLDGLNEASLREAFDPETDFYLDADGNIVFFIQSGVIAGDVAGVLFFPFAPAEMLSAER